MTIHPAERCAAGACVLAAIDRSQLVVAVENADAIDTDFAVVTVTVIADADAAFAISASWAL